MVLDRLKEGLRERLKAAERERKYQQMRKKERELDAKEAAERAYDRAYVQEHARLARERARQKVRGEKGRGSALSGVTMFADKYSRRMENFSWFDEPAKKKKGSKKQKKSDLGWTWF
ncbi:MAG: hypothetical protein JRN68_05710 [Nitrososphaerota archaeon]|nr:hypothetical protein [Nitrososphaerota archaeon]